MGTSMVPDQSWTGRNFHWNRGCGLCFYFSEGEKDLGFMTAA
jgi:hypothetical protein